MEGEVDLIFLDADKHNYQHYLDIILGRKLLSRRGFILVDNGTQVFRPISTHQCPHSITVFQILVFARGFTFGEDFNPYVEKIRGPFWEASGETLRLINKNFVEDPRIDTLILPMFDGVTQIKWRESDLDKKDGMHQGGS